MAGSRGHLAGRTGLHSSHARQLAVALLQPLLQAKCFRHAH